MATKSPQTPGRQAKGCPPRNFREQRTETERRRQEEFARQNAAIAQRLKGAF